MIIGIGVDIISLNRLEEMLEHRGDKLLERFLSPNEISEFLKKGRDVKYLGGRFCAKEAVIKALSDIPEGFRFNRIEVLSGEKGSPEIHFSNEILQKYPIINNYRFHISISHEQNIAISMVVIENVSCP